MDAKFLRMLAANLAACAEQAKVETEKATFNGEKEQAAVIASAGLTIDFFAIALGEAINQLAKEPK